MKIENFKYKIVHFFRYSADAMFYPFFGLYLAFLGFQTDIIGTVLMLFPLIATFVNPLWSFLAKNINANKIYLIIFSLTEAAAIVFLLLINQLLLAIILTAILSVVSQPYYILMDSYTAVFTLENKTNYSAIRLFGSLGYALGVLLSGFLIKNSGFNPSFFVSASLFSLVCIVLLWIKPHNLKNNQELEEKSDFKALRKNKNYILFVIFYIITAGVLFGGESFWGLYFKSIGIDADGFGYISFVAYAIEVVVLVLLAKYGDKIKLNLIMVMIVIFNGIRFLIFAFQVPIYVLVFASALRGFVIAGVLYVIVRYLSVFVRKNNFTLGMIIFGSLKNIVQSAITFFGGFIIKEKGYEIFYLLISLIAFSALFFIKTKPKENQCDIITKEV